MLYLPLLFTMWLHYSLKWFDGCSQHSFPTNSSCYDWIVTHGTHRYPIRRTFLLIIDPFQLRILCPRITKRHGRWDYEIEGKLLVTGPSSAVLDCSITTVRHTTTIRRFFPDCGRKQLCCSEPIICYILICNKTNPRPSRCALGVSLSSLSSPTISFTSIDRLITFNILRLYISFLFAPIHD